MGKFRPIADTVTEPDNKIAENSGKKNKVEEFYLFLYSKFISQCFKSVEIARWTVRGDAKRYFHAYILKIV